MEHFCSYHTITPAVVQCDNCGRWFCCNCVFTVGGKSYCKTRQCGAVYLQKIKDNASAQLSPLTVKPSLIRKTGIGLLIFSVLNLLLSANKPMDSLPMLEQVNSPEMLKIMPGYQNIMSSFTGLLEAIDTVTIGDLFLAVSGILVGICMIITLRPARVLFIIYLSISICFTIGSSYLIYREVQILKGIMQPLSGTLQIMPFLGPMFSGIAAGVGIIILTMLWLLVKFILLREE